MQMSSLTCQSRLHWDILACSQGIERPTLLPSLVIAAVVESLSKGFLPLQPMLKASDKLAYLDLIPPSGLHQMHVTEAAAVRYDTSFFGCLGGRMAKAINSPMIGMPSHIISCHIV